MRSPVLPRVWLSEEAQRSIVAAANEAHPRETGGVLLGVYTAGRRPWVTGAIEICSPPATATFYEIPEGTRPVVVDVARRQDDRLGYLGDWHSHPADVGPSPLDAATMQRLGRDPDARCAHPLLLIARRAPVGYRLDVRQLARRRLRRTRIIAAGGLPSAGTSSARNRFEP